MAEVAQERVMFNADGTFVNPKGLRRAKTLNTISGCLGSLWWQILLGQFLPLYLRKFNGSDVQIGLIVTIMSLAGVFQIVSAYMAEWLGRRKALWAITEFSRRVVMAGIIALPFIYSPENYATAAVWILVILSVASILGNMAVTPWYSWMGDIIPERERGRFWGTRGMIINIFIIVVLPVFGYVLNTGSANGSFRGFTIALIAATLLGLVDIIIHSFIPEPPMSKSIDGMNLSMMMRPLKDPDFRRFFLGWGLFSFATAITTPFYSVYYNELLKVDLQFLSWMASMSIASGIAGMWFWGIMADKFGSKPVFNLCMIASIPPLALFFLADPGNARLILSTIAIVGGFVGAGVAVGFTNLLMGLSPREGRGMFIGVFFAVAGIFGAPAPYIGGTIAQHFPQFVLGGYTKYHNLIALSMLLYVFCLPLFFRIREKRSTPIGVVLSNIVFTNPVRAFAQLGILNYGRSVRSSVNAVRGLGASKTRLATEDLLLRLDDPSVIIREEAINALGEIGDPAAIPALVERLNDREAYPSISIIRALGMIRDEGSIETVAKYLDDEDRHVRAAAARALGEIGSQKAVRPLKELIQREDKPQVIANAVESLGEIGTSADMWEILPHLHGITNPILKRQVALAIGNLLGRRHEFYHILSKERRSPGKAVDMLTGRLFKTIRGRQPDQELQRLLSDFRGCYYDKNVKRCVNLLWDAGYLIAKSVYAFDGPRDLLLEVAVLRDARFAAGLWFLQMLESGEIEPTSDDVILGLYFLASAEYKDVVRLSKGKRLGR